MTWHHWLGLTVVLLAVAAVGISALGAICWAATARMLIGRLEGARIDDADRLRHPGRFDLRELAGLPPPVQRYFRAVLKEGQPLVAAATIEMTGAFNLSAVAEQWKPITSRQRIIARRLGFLWDAKIFFLPGLPVRVVDGYIAGEGLLRAAFLGLFTMANLRGTGDEIARGEFMRYFAEAPWYPTALLPSQGVRWDAVDSASANATLTDGGVTLTLLFRFNEAGLIEAVQAKERGAMVGQGMIMLPWEGRWSDYQVSDGMTVPTRGEAAWLQPEGRKPYFVGTVTSLTYEFEP